jgi:hypothetical protein
MPGEHFRMPGEHLECPASISECPASISECPASISECLASISECPASISESPTSVSECQRGHSDDGAAIADRVDVEEGAVRGFELVGHLRDLRAGRQLDFRGARSGRAPRARARCRRRGTAPRARRAGSRDHRSWGPCCRHRGENRSPEEIAARCAASGSGGYGRQLVHRCLRAHDREWCDGRLVDLTCPRGCGCSRPSRTRRQRRLGARSTSPDRAVARQARCHSGRAFGTASARHAMPGDARRVT